MFDHPIEPRRRKDQVGAHWPIAPGKLRAAATRHNGEPGRIRPAQRRGQFGLIAWLKNHLRLDSSHAISRFRGAQMVPPGDCPQTIPRDGDPGPCW
jgi:hypothetical protein